MYANKLILDCFHTSTWFDDSPVAPYEKESINQSEEDISILLQQLSQSEIMSELGVERAITDVTDVVDRTTKRELSQESESSLTIPQCSSHTISSKEKRSKRIENRRGSMQNSGNSSRRGSMHGAIRKGSISGQNRRGSMQSRRGSMASVGSTSSRVSIASTGSRLSMASSCTTATNDTTPRKPVRRGSFTGSDQAQLTETNMIQFTRASSRRSILYDSSDDLNRSSHSIRSMRSSAHNSQEQRVSFVFENENGTEEQQHPVTEFNIYTVQACESTDADNEGVFQQRLNASFLSTDFESIMDDEDEFCSSESSLQSNPHVIQEGAATVTATVDNLEGTNVESNLSRSLNGSRTFSM